MRSLIADRSTGGATSRGADFTSLIAEASFSDCARWLASSPRSVASDFSSASVRAAAAGSGAGTADLPVADSTLATRAARSSSAAELTCGAAGCRRRRRGPSQRTRRRRSPARRRSRRKLAATIAAETGVAEGRRGRLLRFGLRRRFRRRWRRHSGSRWRLRSLRDRWSAARAWREPDRAMVQYLRACHRPL